MSYCRQSSQTVSPSGRLDIFLVGTERICRVFYVGCPAPKLLLLANYRICLNPTLIFLGASAVAESLSVGCAPAVMPTFGQVLFAGHARDRWCLHCGPSVGEQGGCLTCFLAARRGIRKCPGTAIPQTRTETVRLFIVWELIAEAVYVLG